MPSRQITFNRKEVAVCVFLLLAVGLIFGQTVRHEFINLDDAPYVYENPFVSQGLTASGAAWAFTHGYQSLWIPLTWVSLMADWQLHDVHAGGYHLTNLLLHAATAMLLFLSLHRMTDRFWPSVFAALLFAVHPLRVESVAWVTERKDVLSGLFFMSTLLAYVHYVRRPFSIGRYALVMVLFALGLMAKPMLITLPCVLLLLDYWPLGRMDAAWQTDLAVPSDRRPRQSLDVRKLGRLLIEKIPLFLIAGADCLITMAVQAQSLSINEQLPLSWRIGNALISYVTYLKMFFYPVGLVIVYPRLPLELPPWSVGVSVLILVGLTAACYAARRRCPYLLVGWLWYLGMLTPVIGLVQVGLTSVADRFTYLPQVGLAIGLAWGVADLCRDSKRRARLCGAAAAVALTILAACSFHLTSQWRDSETLWKHVIRCMPSNIVARCNLSNALAEEGRFDDAAAEIRAALEIQPDSSIANYNMGYALMISGRLNEAEPYFAKSLETDPTNADACHRLGMISAKRGQHGRAIAAFRKTLEIAPANSEARYDLGRSLMALGRLADAQAVFDEAAQRAPNYAEKHRRLGHVMAARGRFVEAVEHFERVLDAQPDDVEARETLVQLTAAIKAQKKPTAAQ